LKTIGLIGGMSWESSLTYYRLINERVKSNLGALHSAKCILYSVDFEEIEILQHQEKWNELTDIMVDIVKRLNGAGADFIVICTNTMHKMVPEIEARTNSKILHIADVTAKEIKQKRLKKVGLLGTKFTMEQDFYKSILQEKHKIEVIIPGEKERNIIHNVIYEELCKGIIRKDSKKQYEKIIACLVEQGAEGIVLGCTEIPLLINQADCSVPVFDTTQIHAAAAADFALE